MLACLWPKNKTKKVPKRDFLITHPSTALRVTNIALHVSLSEPGRRAVED
jgi:hypothetical protein